MERQIIISYNWYNADDNKIQIDLKHQEALEESAWKRVVEMVNDGYTSGELNDTVRMHDADPDDGINYRGWWAVTYKTIDEG